MPPGFRPSPHRRRGVIPLAAVLLLGLAAAGWGDAPQIWAIRGARIVPVSGAPIDSGTVVVRDGLIEAVGAGVPVPADARVIEGKGLTVYPGLIDCGSDVGLPAAPAATPAPGGAPGAPGTPGQRRQGAPAAAPADETPNMNPFYRAADALNDGGQRADAARQAGITTVLTVPQRGIFTGQSALVNLNGDPSTMVVRTPVAMHLRLAGGFGFGREYPAALMGKFAYVRQAFLDTRRYSESWSLYRQNVRSLRRPETSRAFEALQPVVEKRLPLVVPADSPAEVQRAIRLGEESEVSVWISGGAEAGQVGPLLKDRGVPVLVSLKFPERPRDPNPDDEESLRAVQRRVEAPKNAAALVQAGVKFAFFSDGLAPRDFIRAAGRVVRAGLPADAALRALTLSAAEIFGAAEQLGSIERGKIANLVVTDGDLFAENTQVRYAFVDGKRYEVPETARPQASLTGRWSAQIADRNVTFQLTQMGPRLTGTFATPLATAPLTSGSVMGSSFRFQATATIDEKELLLTFTGTIEGDTLKGSVNVGGMDVPFTATRAPMGAPNAPLAPQEGER